MSAKKGFITGMTGVYLVAAELSKQGIIATITSRNAPGVDIIASTPNLKRVFSIQVKTNSKNASFWLLNEHAKETYSPNFVYVFVNLRDGGADFYIVPSKKVSRAMYVGKAKTGKKQVWYSYQRKKEDKDRWNLLT